MIRARSNSEFSHKFGIDPLVGNEITKLALAIPAQTYGTEFPKGATFGDEHYYTGESTTSYKTNNWYKKTITRDVWQSINATSLIPENMQEGRFGPGVLIDGYLSLLGGNMGGVINFDPLQTFSASRLVGTLPAAVVAPDLMPKAGGQFVGDVFMMASFYFGSAKITSAGLITGATGAISMWTNDSGYLTAETDPVFGASEASLLVAGDKAKLDSALQTETDPVFSVAEAVNFVVGDKAKLDSALQPNATADGTYPVYNDGVTSGQLSGITILNGLVTAVTVVP